MYSNGCSEEFKSLFQITVTMDVRFAGLTIKYLIKYSPYELQEKQNIPIFIYQLSKAKSFNI